MRFYLGLGDRARWLERLDVPMMMSYRWLTKAKRLPSALGPWALDSGGFTELKLQGKWTIAPFTYVAECRRIAEAVGMPEFIAPQDWMCEPDMLARTGLSVEEHQRRTVENFCELRAIASDLPIVPVLQGWTIGDYMTCWDFYRAAGVNLEEEPLVGLGSVCRRQDTTTAEVIVLELRPLKLHGFGMKVTGLERYGYLLVSSDSMAWSYGGWRRGPCPPPSRCANHMHYALEWRQRLLRSMDYQQTHLMVTP